MDQPGGKGSSLPIATGVHEAPTNDLSRTPLRNARQAGCEWLHVDFDEGLEPFYFEACGFRPTPVGLT